MTAEEGMNRARYVGVGVGVPSIRRHDCIIGG